MGGDRQRGGCGGREVSGRREAVGIVVGNRGGGHGTRSVTMLSLYVCLWLWLTVTHLPLTRSSTAAEEREVRHQSPPLRSMHIYIGGRYNVAVYLWALQNWGGGEVLLGVVLARISESLWSSLRFIHTFSL